MIKLFHMILISIMMSACVPVLKKDYYLSFEKAVGISSVEVLDKIPVEYRLNRDEYTVRLRLDKKGRLRLYINSEDIHASPLAIESRPVGGVSEERRCGLMSEPYPKDNVPEQGTVVFSWYIKRSGCEVDELKDRKLTLNFVVIGKNNQLLGVENIPFEVKKNGLRVAFDAI